MSLNVYIECNRNEADTRTTIFVLILVFTIGVVIRFLNEVEIKDEPVRINYVPTVTWTSSAYIGTPTTTTL